MNMKVVMMNEYKKLLILDSAIKNLEGIPIPFNIIKEFVNPLRDWVKYRINEMVKIEEKHLEDEK